MPEPIPDPQGRLLVARMRELRTCKDALVSLDRAGLLTPESLAAILAVLMRETLIALEDFAAWQETHFPLDSGEGHLEGRL